VFKSEAQMTEPVVRWLRAAGLSVKAEFAAPWGICDLVGVSFRQKSIKHRMRLGQSQSITSISRALVLLSIPDEETGRSVSLKALVEEYSSSIPSHIVDSHTTRLISEGFVISTSSGELQRRNGWFPLHKRLVAVELKLHRIEEVLSQAQNNLMFATESYVALPKDVAIRVSEKRARWAPFFESGVGLISVTKRACDVLIRPRRQPSTTDNIIQFCCVEKFWRTL
jgi:hypothetical protein